MEPVLAKLRKHPFVAAICVFILIRIACSFFVGPTTCNDGWHSSSIGRRGACSWHHGVGTNWGDVLATLVSLGVAGLAFVLLTSDKRKSESEDDSAKTSDELPTSVPSDSQLVRSEMPIMSPDSKPKCPRCNSAMRLRNARRGKYQGQTFWGCANYPYCKGTRNLSEMVSPLAQL
jgi:topoisomerase-like DNA binding C4 zinc finger protein